MVISFDRDPAGARGGERVRCIHINKLELIMGHPKGCPVSTGVARQPVQEGPLSAGLFPHFPCLINQQVPELSAFQISLLTCLLHSPGQGLLCGYVTCAAARSPYLEGPMLPLVLCCHSSEIPNIFWTSDPAFPFCTGPHKLCSCPWLVKGPSILRTGPYLRILFPNLQALSLLVSSAMRSRAHLLRSETFSDNVHTV